MTPNAWAEALQESEDPTKRDANLWAQCFAEADGDESKAKATYVKTKVGERSKEQETAHDPRRGYCPSCSAEIDIESTYCTGCRLKLEGSLRPTRNRKGLWAEDKSAPTNPQPFNVVKMAKSRGTYVVLGVLLGMLGIHNFYAGRFMRGGLQLASTTLLGWLIVGLFITFFWVLIDLFTVTTDGSGDPFA